ncbi:MAG TPA: PLP-dependent aminotransferase family protein [Bacteroidales bacterium]|nr:PLP-dependent aminotransferase family protein [Bacteroidales bacterium]
MVNNLENIFSDAAERMKKSEIRELLKLTQKPEIISFAGGLPATSSFPIEELKEIACEVLEKEGANALQYSTTEGDNELRKLLVEKYQQKEGLNITINNIIITTASQQGLDLIGKIFINPGDKIICGLPSYLGGLQAFQAYGADMVGIRFDKYGMDSSILRNTLKELKNKNQLPKFIYIIPDFQNPAGITMPEWRRKEIIEIAHEFNLLIVEDSPYREIRFEGESQRTIHALDGTGQVILLGTFSKIFVPGFRIGWMIANERIIDKVVSAKQSADLCTSAFVQKIAALYIKKGYFEKKLQKIIKDYKEKRDNMIQAFKDYMPEGVTWTEPEGGLFLFLHLPKKMDASHLFARAIKGNVAFVIGSVFHCDGSGKNTARINFSFCSKEVAREGVKRLAKAIKDEIAELEKNKV